MNTATNEQLSFARTMTQKQWQALRGLHHGAMYLSASERGDPEIYALVEHKLAETFGFKPGTYPVWGWHITKAGMAIMRRRNQDKI